MIDLRPTRTGVLLAGAAITAMVAIAGCSSASEKPAPSETPSATPVPEPTDKSVRTNVTKAPIGQSPPADGVFRPSVIAPPQNDCSATSCGND